MKRKFSEENFQEEEGKIKKRFISSCKIVEYLGPLMSKDLLFKFPDNSAFDFDYSQSSIWSPLVPRVHSPMDYEFDSGSIKPKKLAFGFGLNSENKSKKIDSAIKMKLKKGKNKKKVLAYGFSPTPFKASCLPFAAKGWNKVLRGATKHFKKKKRDSTGHVRLSNYLTDFKS